MAAAIPIIGGSIAAIGFLNQGQTQKNAYQFETAAKTAQAAQVDIAADREIELIKRRAEKTQAAQMVAFGKSGVLATTGSPLMLMEQTVADAMDEITATRNAANYRKSTLFSEAGLSSYLGQEAEDASYYNAAGGILTAFSGNPYVYDAPRKTGGNL